METELNSVWDEYRQTGSHDSLSRLTLQYAPLVKFVAHRTGEGASLGRVERGLHGLQAAIETYASHDGANFDTWAMECISEAVGDADSYAWDNSSWEEAG